MSQRILDNVRASYGEIAKSSHCTRTSPMSCATTV